MSVSSSFNSHLVSLYNSYWNRVTDIRLMLLSIDSENLNPDTTLNEILSAEIPASNGYVSGGQPLGSHSSTYDALQQRAEGRPPSVSFTAVGGPITFNTWVVVANNEGQVEPCFFFHYQTQQVIAEGNTLEITTKINLGSSLSDVGAPD